MDIKFQVVESLNFVFVLPGSKFSASFLKAKVLQTKKRKDFAVVYEKASL